MQVSELSRHLQQRIRKLDTVVITYTWIWRTRFFIVRVNAVSQTIKTRTIMHTQCKRRYLQSKIDSYSLLWKCKVRVTNLESVQCTVRGCGWIGQQRKMCGRVGLKSGQRAWDVSSKSGLVSSAQKRPALCWAAAKPDKQAHHSAARLSLLPLPHAARQQTVCRPTRTLITFSPHAAVPTWHGYRCVCHSEGQKRTARSPRMAQHHCSTGLGIVTEAPIPVPMAWLW